MKRNPYLLFFFVTVLVFMASTAVVDYGQNKRIYELEKKAKAPTTGRAPLKEIDMQKFKGTGFFSKEGLLGGQPDYIKPVR